MIHRYVRKFGVDPVDQFELLMLRHAVDRQPLRLSKAELDLPTGFPGPPIPPLSSTATAESSKSTSAPK